MRQISNISQTSIFPAITTTQAASEVMLLKSSRFVAVHFLSSTLWRVVIFYDRSVESCVGWEVTHPPCLLIRTLIITFPPSQPVLCRPTNFVRHIFFKRGWDIIWGPAQDRPLRSADLAGSNYYFMYLGVIMILCTLVQLLFYEH